jgi:hypothetical protein
MRRQATINMLEVHIFLYLMMILLAMAISGLLLMCKQRANQVFSIMVPLALILIGGFFIAQLNLVVLESTRTLNELSPDKKAALKNKERFAMLVSYYIVLLYSYFFMVALVVLLVMCTSRLCRELRRSLFAADGEEKGTETVEYDIEGIMTG